MEQLERPDETTWDERRLWFEELAAEVSERGIARPSEQAAALAIDLQAVFCAGAWAAAVILAAAIVEMQIQARGQPRPAALREELRWLQGLRNELLHEPSGKPALTIEDQWQKRREWERQARQAVRLAMTALHAPAEDRKSGMAE